MDSEGIRQRKEDAGEEIIAPALQPTAEIQRAKPTPSHPAVQGWRVVLIALYFLGSALSIHMTQWAALPLYLWDKDWYYAWQALLKKHFSVLMVIIQQWWSPTTVIVTGDKSVRGQLRRTSDGRLEAHFPERILILANHQIYTDWLYLWWHAYANDMAGHFFIILKDELKYIPLLGPGMLFFSFVFLARKWAQDKPRFKHRLDKLKRKQRNPITGQSELVPMWMLIFPEGTNMSKNGRAKSQAWAKKSGKPDLEHVLLPRSTGLHFCLEQVKGTVDWVYDCTMAYEGLPPGQYAQDVWTIKSIYIDGHGPKSVSMHWRRFAVADIPEDETKFDKWLEDRWAEKDELLAYYEKHGAFPYDDEVITEYEPVPNGAGISKTVTSTNFVQTTVQPGSYLEVVQIYMPTLTGALILHLGWRFWNWLMVTLTIRKIDSTWRNF